MKVVYKTVNEFENRSHAVMFLQSVVDSICSPDKRLMRRHGRQPCIIIAIYSANQYTYAVVDHIRSSSMILLNRGGVTKRIGQQKLTNGKTIS